MTPSAAKAGFIAKDLGYGLKAVPFRKLRFSASPLVGPLRIRLMRALAPEVRRNDLRRISCDDCAAAY
jgi:hypothetical protein